MNLCLIIKEPIISPRENSQTEDPEDDYVHWIPAEAAELRLRVQGDQERPAPRLHLWYESFPFPFPKTSLHPPFLQNRNILWNQ